MSKFTTFSSQKYVLYSILTYNGANSKFIKENAIEIYDVNEVVKFLQSDNGYHFRIHKKEQYIFFGDLDNYSENINVFFNLLKDFLKKRYDIIITRSEFFYTQNNQKEHSYHYSIPKLNASTEKLKEIHNNFIKDNTDKFIYKDEANVKKKIVDTTIYSEHWFRCPNQKKGIKIDDTSMHVIKEGNMKDFIITYIQKNSTDINNILFIEEEKPKKIICRKKNLKKNINIVEKSVEKNNVIQNNMSNLVNDNDEKRKEQNILNQIDLINPELVHVDPDQKMMCSKTCNKIIKYDTEKFKKDNVMSTMISNPILYKKIFDECYKQERFDVYESWIAVGMALKNMTFDEEQHAFEIFNYFSSKGNNYDGTEQTQKKFNTFIKKETVHKYTVATIYYYAREDNKPQFVKIMNNNKFDLEQYDMCTYMKKLAGNQFKYILKNGIHKLYCFNGRTWEKDDTLFKNFLSSELYEFLKMILTEVYFEDRSLNQMTNQIKKLKNTDFKRGVVETYKEVGTDVTLKLDDKCYLLGFNNVVYDLESGNFRDYKYDDYVSNTTEYDWREPSIEEINTMNQIIEQIMPIEEERLLYLQILATALDGNCLEHCIILNGFGGNGKSFLNSVLLVALGSKYSMIGNNSILFELNKTGSNPEKANIHKKRLVVFREPPEKNKFCNSVIKELTGGGYFSARGHHESDAQKELNLTMIIECNKRPLFSEEPTNAEVRRIIDIYFRSTFTMDPKLIDHENYVYMANPKYKEIEFQEKHKYALLKILMGEYKKYKLNNSILIIPKSIEERTQTYLELSCNLVTWFKDNYEHTGNKNDICKVKDIYSDLTTSIYFFNLSKNEKKKYSKSYVTEYIQNNIFFAKYYKLKSNLYNNFVSQWKKKITEKDENDEDYKNQKKDKNEVNVNDVILIE